MTTNYTIYLINESASTQLFWCFLERPEELASQSGVYANSSANLAVASNSPAINTFTIPVQYVVGAGASNNAVGLNVLVQSNITQKADIGQVWDASYATVPPQMGPTMTLDSATSPANTIGIKANAFNQVNNEANGWFSNMSFGIQTNQGFMGMTWSPTPSQTRTLTPQLKFYVAVGSYGSNTLASWTDVSNDAAEVSVPADFQYNKSTVTYTATGQWNVTPGAPSTAQLAAAAGRTGQLNSLLRSHMSLAAAHESLVNDLSLSAPEPTPNAERRLTDGASGQDDTVVKVVWHSQVRTAEVGEVVLAGTLTVGTALTAAFTAFVLSGIRFSIKRAPVGGTTIEFSYSGSRSADFVKSLFQAGAQLFLQR
jgi:hypothetical protein